MEVIARCRGKYPFDSNPSQMVAYVQVLKENLSEAQIRVYQLKSVLLKQMGSDRFIKLLKTYREGNNIMMLYQYQKTSINKCIETLSTQQEKRNGKCTECINCFTTNLGAIIDLLIHYQVKVDLLIENFAVVQKDGHFQLKLFVDPDSEFMALQLPMLDHAEIKSKMKQNRTILKQFYEAEKKRMINDYEQVLESVMGKLDSPEKIHPNFLIKGSKLIFIQDSNAKQGGHGHYKDSHSIDKMQHIHRKPDLVSLHNQRTQLKQKYRSKIEQIRLNLKKIESHHPHYPRHQQNSPQKVSEKRAQKESNDTNKAPNNNETRIKDQQNHESFKYTQLFDKLERELKKEGKKQEQAEQEQYEERLSFKEFEENGETHSHNSQNFEKTNSSIQQARKQKYKMKIVTSHDIQVEKVDHPEVQEFKGQNRLIQNLKKMAGTPPLDYGCQPKVQNNEDEEKQVESPLHSRKSDLGPRSSIPFVDDQNQLSGLKPIGNQSQQEYGTSLRPIKGKNDPKAKMPYTVAQFSDKIREAKWKAERILRQYTKGRKKN